MYMLLNGKVNKELLLGNEHSLVPFLKHRSNEVLLFVSYSSFDIKIGQKFQVVFDKRYPGGAMEFGDCILKRVTQQMFKEWDEIPQGWKTITLMEFDNGIPKMIAELPQIDSWIKGKAEILISTLEFWQEYCKGEKPL